MSLSIEDYALIVIATPPALIGLDKASIGSVSALRFATPLSENSFSETRITVVGYLPQDKAAHATVNISAIPLFSSQPGQPQRVSSK
jgi:hypothetical protein